MTEEFKKNERVFLFISQIMVVREYLVYMVGEHEDGTPNLTLLEINQGERDHYSTVFPHPSLVGRTREEAIRFGLANADQMIRHWGAVRSHLISLLPGEDPPPCGYRIPPPRIYLREPLPEEEDAEGGAND